MVHIENNSSVRVSPALQLHCMEANAAKNDGQANSSQGWLDADSMRQESGSETDVRVLATNALLTRKELTRAQTNLALKTRVQLSSGSSSRSSSVCSSDHNKQSQWNQQKQQEQLRRRVRITSIEGAGTTAMRPTDREGNNQNQEEAELEKWRVEPELASLVGESGRVGGQQSLLAAQQLQLQPPQPQPQAMFSRQEQHSVTCEVDTLTSILAHVDKVKKELNQLVGVSTDSDKEHEGTKAAHKIDGMSFFGSMIGAELGQYFCTAASNQYHNQQQLVMQLSNYLSRDNNFAPTALVDSDETHKLAAGSEGESPVPSLASQIQGELEIDEEADGEQTKSAKVAENFVKIQRKFSRISNFKEQFSSIEVGLPMKNVTDSIESSDDHSPPISSIRRAERDKKVLIQRYANTLQHLMQRRNELRILDYQLLQIMTQYLAQIDSHSIGSLASLNWPASPAPSVSSLSTFQSHTTENCSSARELSHHNRPIYETQMSPNYNYNFLPYNLPSMVNDYRDYDGPNCIAIDLSTTDRLAQGVQQSLSSLASSREVSDASTTDAPEARKLSFSVNLKKLRLLGASQRANSCASGRENLPHSPDVESGKEPNAEVRLTDNVDQSFQTSPLNLLARFETPPNSESTHRNATVATIAQATLSRSASQQKSLILNCNQQQQQTCKPMAGTNEELVRNLNNVAPKNVFFSSTIPVESYVSESLPLEPQVAHVSHDNVRANYSMPSPPLKKFRASNQSTSSFGDHANYSHYNINQQLNSSLFNATKKQNNGSSNHSQHNHHHHHHKHLNQQSDQFSDYLRHRYAATIGATARSALSFHAGVGQTDSSFTNGSELATVPTCGTFANNCLSLAEESGYDLAANNLSANYEESIGNTSNKCYIRGQDNRAMGYIMTNRHQDLAQVVRETTRGGLCLVPSSESFETVSEHQHPRQQQQHKQLASPQSELIKHDVSAGESLGLVRATMSDDHKSMPMVAASLQQKMGFRCHVCGSGFEDRHRLQQHLSIHLNLHPSWFEEKTIKETMTQYELKRGDYLCPNCNVRFETTAEFDKHMQVHGDKPHRCGLCSEQDNKLVSFRYYRQLLTHLRSHCFLYSCRFVPECKQTANRKDYLKLHILKHHLNNKLPEQYTVCCH